jgi:RNA polymerase sigma-70 factor (ECF subfamily)
MPDPAPPDPGPDPGRSSADLALAAAAGDRAAAADLVARCHPQVVRLVRAHLPRRTAEEDLVQEVFVKLLARLDQYRPQGAAPFEAWLARLAINTCLDALRAEARHGAPVQPRLSDAAHGWLDWLHGDAGPAADPAIDDALAARDLVERLLSHLAPRDRLLLTLLDRDGLTVAEVSAQTGWNAAVIKVRAFRARHRLRAIAHRLGETP